jgi:hypothetical protein
MVENPIVGPKFRPFSVHISFYFSKFTYTTIALILKCLYECTTFHTFSTFSSVM